MSLALLLACQIENGLVEPDQDVTEPVFFAPDVEYPAVDMTVDVALQRMHWGEQTTRCQIQIAFHKPLEDDHPSGNGGGDSNAQGVIHIPDDPGTCMYSDLAPSQAPPSEESHDNNEHDNQGENDNWQEAGEIFGAPQIFLHSAERTITLHQQPLADGQVRYEWDGCNEEAFPFGEIFDIEVPDHDEEGALPGFYVVEAFGVGPDLTLQDPVPNDSHRLNHENTIDLWADWDFLGEVPRVRGQELVREVQVFIRNYEFDQDGQGTPEFEALACTPPGDWNEIRDDDLALLIPNPSADTNNAPFYGAFQVDASYQSPEIELPWGQALRIRTMVTEGGAVHLWEPTDVE